jgi:hypothetical protein
VAIAVVPFNSLEKDYIIRIRYSNVEHLVEEICSSGGGRWLEDGGFAAASAPNIQGLRSKIQPSLRLMSLPCNNLSTQNIVDALL